MKNVVTICTIIVILAMTSIGIAQDQDSTTEALPACTLTEDDATYARLIEQNEQVQAISDAEPDAAEVNTLYEEWRELRVDLPECAEIVELDQMILDRFVELFIAISGASASDATEAETTPDETAETQETTDDSPTTTTMYVNGNARARECPQLDCTVVTVLPAGEAVELINFVSGASVSGSDSWGEVQYNGDTIFIHSSLLGETQPAVQPVVDAEPPAENQQEQAPQEPAPPAEPTATPVPPPPPQTNAGINPIPGDWTLYMSQMGQGSCLDVESFELPSSEIWEEQVVDAFLVDDGSAFSWIQGNTVRDANGNYGGDLHLESGNTAQIELTPVDDRTMHGIIRVTFGLEGGRLCSATFGATMAKD